jgi:LPS O-antigen subunit length determinant protein (WzzB/FepE family)
MSDSYRSAPGQLTVASPSDTDQLDLINLVRVLWAGKWWVIGLSVFAAAVSVAVVLNMPNQYKASAVLNSTTGSSLSGISSQLSGLASLAGVTLGTGDNDESQVAIEVLQSWAFIDQFIRENRLEVPVFAAKGWNKQTGALEIDNKIYDEATNRWVRDPPRGKPVEPTSWELYDTFSDRLSVSQDKKTGLVTVSIEYYSPRMASEWVGKLVKAINEHMRQRKLESSNKNIEYLQAQVDKTSVAEMKAVFYQLIENEIKNKMLAEASPEYQFVTVSPAMIPEEKSKPKRAIIVVLSTVLGGLIGVFIVTGRRAYV